MVRLKSRTQSCVNGFWFRQAQTGWEKQTWDFEGLCQDVQAHRLANPRHNLPTDLANIRSEVDHYNARRMQSIRGADIYIFEDAAASQAPPFPSAPPRGRSLISAVGGAKHVVAGVGVLIDWLGSGAMPVTAEIANARAVVCTTCPLNKDGDIMAIFTEPIANKLRTQLAMRHDLNLTTPQDPELKICSACHCPLKLKVFTPASHIQAHLSDSVKTALDPHCWILKELHEQGNP